MDFVNVKRRCSKCGKQISAEIERDDFFEEAVRLFKCAVCWACGEFATRRLRIDDLKKETWVKLRDAKSARRKAKDSSRYGSRGSDAAASETSRQEKDLREQLEILAKKELALAAECQEYQTEQKKGAENEGREK